MNCCDGVGDLMNCSDVVGDLISCCDIFGEPVDRCDGDPVNRCDVGDLMNCCDCWPNFAKQRRNFRSFMERVRSVLKVNNSFFHNISVNRFCLYFFYKLFMTFL